MNLVEYRLRTGRRPFSPAFAAAAKAMAGIPLDATERDLFATMSGGRSERPGIGWDEAFINAGRGSGKDDFVSSVANHASRFGGHEVAAAPGQRLPFQVVCPLRNQAQGTIRFVQGEAQLPFNRRFVARTTTDAVEFTNGTVVTIQTCDDVAVVGDTLTGLAFNEWALFPGDGAAGDAKLVEANARPALRRMRGTPRKTFIKLGSSYIKEGAAWECFRDRFGRDDSDVLVLTGPTAFWNPNIDPEFLAGERRKLGELLFAMHYECAWVDAVTEAWFGTETISRARMEGMHELPWDAGVPVQVAMDLSTSMNSTDKVGWAVASSRAGTYDFETDTRGPRRTVLHACGSWPVDRSPREIARRIRDEVCSRFGTKVVLIDQYSDAAFAQLCRDVGLKAVVIPWRGGESSWLANPRIPEDQRKLSKADRYRSVRTAMSSGDLRIPDVADLIADLHACRGTLLPGGGERIEVPRTIRGHGDVLSAAVMALSEALIGNARIPTRELTPWEKYNRANAAGIAIGAMPPMEPYPLFGKDCGSVVRTVVPVVDTNKGK